MQAVKNQMAHLSLCSFLLLGFGCAVDVAPIGGEPNRPGPSQADDDDFEGDDDDDATPPEEYGDDDAGDDDDSDSDWDPPPDGGSVEVVPPKDLCEEAVEEPVTWFMSADDSNSQARPVIVRHGIEMAADAGGHSFGLGGGRSWEFLNYYSFDLEPAEDGSVRLVPQLRPDPERPGVYSFLVAVVAPSVSSESRRPLNLTLSVDTSGSMGGAPITRLRETLMAISSELREGDVVSVVEWDAGLAIHLESHPISGPYDPVLVSVIEGLHEGGGTNLEAGLATAYRLASDNFVPGSMNRVVLVSDGGANLGVTSADLIAEHAEDGEGEGIYLVGVGASGGYYDDHLMDTITDLGKGAYVYIDSEAEAYHQFTGERFLQNLEIAAQDVRLSVTLPEGVIIEVFHGEELSTEASEVRPQHLSPNDAMLYHQEIRDCSADESSADLSFGFEVTFTDPGTREERSVTSSATLHELLLFEAEALEKANALIAWSELLAAPPEDYPELGGRISDAAAAAPDDPDLAEVDRLRALFMGG